MLCSIFINIFLYARNEYLSIKEGFYISEQETLKSQLLFINDFVSSKACEVNRQIFNKYLDDNGFSFKERYEADFVYLVVKNITIRFDNNGELLSIMPDR